MERFWFFLAIPVKIVIPGSCIVNNMFMMNEQTKEIDSCTRCKCRVRQT